MATKTKTKTKLNIKPLADRVVVEALEETEQMRGGLYIPDTAKEKPMQGRVMAVGPGRRPDKGNKVTTEVSGGESVR
jgi:chaperonin GroES